MLEYAGLSSRHADRQRLAVCHAKLDDIGAVALRTVDHNAVLAARRSHAHLPRSFDQSSSASRFTAAASGFFILSQSGERPERYIESFRFDTMPSSPILHAWAKTVGPSPSKCSLKRRPRP